MRAAVLYEVDSPFRVEEVNLDEPKYVDLFMTGKLPIDKLITRNYSLDHINEAVQALEKGEVIRSVIRF